MTDSIVTQIAELSEMDMDELKRLWTELYPDIKPPSAQNLNRIYIARRLAYRLQEIAHGGLPDTTRTQLRKMIKNPTPTQRKRNNDLPPAGTHLIREWRGIEHRVTVLHDGFEYDRKKYKSLSVIARVITGTRWSGPLFFGLKTQDKKEAA